MTWEMLALRSCDWDSCPKCYNTHPNPKLMRARDTRLGILSFGQELEEVRERIWRDFWMRLEAMHQLTTELEARTDLRVDLRQSWYLRTCADSQSIIWNSDIAVFARNFGFTEHG